MEKLSYKLYPVYGVELIPAKTHGTHEPRYKFVTKRLTTLAEVRRISRHGVVDAY